MKSNSILETVARAFAGIRLGGKKVDPKLAALDRGVLTVALLVAALDGSILPDEYAVFVELAKKCRGGSAKNVRTLLDKVLPAVGRLTAMAQLAVYTEKERVEAFVTAAIEALPSGFVDGSLADQRRAFALWVAMGLSDGEFGAIERKAVDMLRKRFAAISDGREQRLKAREDRLSQLSPMHALAYRTTPARVAAYLEADFLDRAEKVLKDFADAAKREQAIAAFDGLVGLIPTVDETGRKVVGETCTMTGR